MTRAALLKTIPSPVRAYILRTGKSPSEDMLRKNGYGVITDGLYKWVATHDQHVLKFAHAPRNSRMIDQEIDHYESLNREQRRIVVPMFSVVPGISIVVRVLVDDPAKREIQKWDGIALLVKHAFADMGIHWCDDHGGNIGFMPERCYPVIIDLDFLERT